jgi:hypothetical protein
VEINTRLIDDVLKIESSNANNYDVLAILYKGVFNYLLFRNKTVFKMTLPELSMLDNKDEKKAAVLEAMSKEVGAALESVIPRAALTPFLLLNNTEKVTQLTELSNLVLGIRLFNKEIGKGGATLGLKADIVNNSDRNLGEIILQNLEYVFSLAMGYTNYLEMLKMLHEENLATENYKEELIFLRQYLNYLQILKDNVENSENQIETSSAKYEKERNDLKNLLGSKSSAPKE